MNNYNSLDFCLSLCKKAGLLTSGESLVEKSIQNNKCYLVIIANDASKNTKDKFFKKSEFYNIPIIFYSTKEELGHKIGKNFAASISILDKGFKDKILSEYDLIK